MTTKNMMSYSIFVIFHKELHEEQYAGKEKYFKFAKVGDQPKKIRSEEINKNVVECSSLSGFTPKGKEWAESEFLISLYNTIKKDSNFLNGSTHIGFLQYDHTCISKSGIDIIEYLNTNCEKIDSNTVLSFVPINLEWEIYSNRICMDFSDPQKQYGNPSCYFPMIAAYNKFYETKYTYSEFITNSKHKSLSLCSSFVMTVDNYMKMMEFSIWAAETQNIDQFDPAKIWRAPGGLMERYYATWLCLSNIKLIDSALGELPKF